jgi:hypothetical protein
METLESSNNPVTSQNCSLDFAIAFTLQKHSTTISPVYFSKSSKNYIGQTGKQYVLTRHKNESVTLINEKSHDLEFRKNEHTASFTVQ